MTYTVEELKDILEDDDSTRLDAVSIEDAVDMLEVLKQDVEALLEVSIGAAGSIVDLEKLANILRNRRRALESISAIVPAEDSGDGCPATKSMFWIAAYNNPASHITESLFHRWKRAPGFEGLLNALVVPSPSPVTFDGWRELVLDFSMGCEEVIVPLQDRVQLLLRLNEAMKSRMLQSKMDFIIGRMREVVREIKDTALDVRLSYRVSLVADKTAEVRTEMSDVWLGGCATLMRAVVQKATGRLSHADFMRAANQKASTAASLSSVLMETAWTVQRPSNSSIPVVRCDALEDCLMRLVNELQVAMEGAPGGIGTQDMLNYTNSEGLSLGGIIAGLFSEDQQDTNTNDDRQH